MAIAWVTSMAFLAACGVTNDSSGSAGSQSDKIKVVATTTILGDVVSQVGGDAIDLTVLLPTGVDPHSFEPAPKDLTAVADADLIFINGAGLEEFLNRLLENAAGASDKVINTSDGIKLRDLEETDTGPLDEPEAQDVDPHVWFDPTNVITWTRNIEKALSGLDPANAQTYTANADTYRAKLRELDTWIKQQVAQIPPDRRKLVTDHEDFGYFADRYGFEQVGAVIPSFNAAAEPSAQGLAELENAIKQAGVQAIFVGTTVNPSLAERVATDTGAKVVSLYTGSLSAPGGEAGTYLALMRYDVTAIVKALK
ncbi:MAG TPA: metal ABC transporter substrate-binding protein [Anaerolineales bacterium]|nr:metal ABC transporter substrate-binding protein [Anaerolineales bacterium]